MRATAGHAVYEGTGECAPDRESARRRWRPAAYSRQSGCIPGYRDAFAHGNVKATWIDNGSGDAGTAKTAQQSRPAGSGPGQGSVALGGKGPRTRFRLRLNCIRRRARSLSGVMRGYGSRQTPLLAGDCA